jgi:hypothetical protein
LELDPWVYALAGNSTVFYLHYARLSGSSLQGSWRLARLGYEAPEGSISIIQRAIIDSVVKDLNKQYTDDVELYLTVDAGWFRAYTFWHAADYILESWARDSAGHDITADTINQCQVRFTGNESHEVVTVSGDADSVVWFTSNDTAHADYPYYTGRIRRCPNNDRPPWWQDFLDDNIR